MRKITLAAPKMKGGSKKGTDVLSIVIDALTKNGFSVKPTGSKRVVEYTINNDLFYLYLTRDGYVGFIGGEPGYTGDEKVGYTLTDLFVGITEEGKKLDSAIKKAINILKKNSRPTFPIKGISEKDIKAYPINFVAEVDGATVMCVLDRSMKKGLDTESFVLASTQRKLIGKHIPNEKFTDAHLVTDFADFHDWILHMAQFIK